MGNINWLFELKTRAPQFLEKLKGAKVPGFFHYSLSGDLHSENVKWGLGNTVFAVKIYYNLDLLDTLPKEKKTAIAGFIKSFQKKDGTIYDPLIKRKTFFREKLSAVKNLDFNNFFHQQTIRAETRQAISALKLLGEKPDFSYQEFPRTKEEVEKFLCDLDWKKPWGAGSHFSHLLFFLKNSDLANKQALIDFTINWADKLQSPKDGAWYKGDPSLQQKINGAMKIITGLRIIGEPEFRYPEELIDLCFSAEKNMHACDNFNIVYVLKYANELLGFSCRYGQIREFVFDILDVYKSYYYPEIGGFSFFPDRANVYYYGAKLTRGLNEPDIHGTCMFLWGISIIGQILEIDKKLGFNEQIP